MTIGEKIKEIRTQLGMSVRAFGKFVDYDFTQISRIERGDYAPTRKPPAPCLDLISKICNATNCDLAMFLEETGYIPPRPADEVELFEIYRSLAEDKKTTLLDAARSLR